MIAIEAERLAEMQTNFAELTGRRPDAAETRRMLAAEVDQEIYYREALARGLLERDSGVETRLIQKMRFLGSETELEDAPALLARAVELGLHRDDIVVRRILIQKMKLMGSALAASQIPTRSEIEAAYEESREALRSPDRRSLIHVFLSADRRGTSIASDAETLHRRLLDSTAATEQAPALGDPFPLGHRLERRTQGDLERSFGGGFAEHAFGLEVGVWSEPVDSAYGEHLILVERIEAGEVPPLEQVFDRLRLEIEERRRNENLEALVSDLRTRYQVVLPETARAPEAAGPPRPLRHDSREQEPG